MQLNDTVNDSGIFQEIDDICDSDSTTYGVKKKTRRVNSSLETLIGKILLADGTWDWDDTNNTDEPIGTGTLEEGIGGYSFVAEYLEIKKIKVLDLGGNLQPLKPIDEAEIPSGIAIEEYFADTGFPTHYDKLGDTIKIYPAPTATACTLTSGLKIEFSRTASLFAADGTDTSKEPGIISTAHIILAWMAALPYCKIYKKDRVAQLERDIRVGIEDMIAFYSKREKDKRHIRTNKRIIHQ